MGSPLLERCRRKDPSPASKILYRLRGPALNIITAACAKESCAYAKTLSARSTIDFGRHVVESHLLAMLVSLSDRAQLGQANFQSCILNL